MQPQLGDLQLSVCFGQFMRQKADIQFGQYLPRRNRVARLDAKAVEAGTDMEGEVDPPLRIHQTQRRHAGDVVAALNPMDRFGRWYGCGDWGWA